MIQIQEYPEKVLNPIWERMVELIERGEYNQGREDIKFIYRETNRIISAMERVFPPKNTKRPMNRRTNKP